MAAVGLWMVYEGRESVCRAQVEGLQRVEAWISIQGSDVEANAVSPQSSPVAGRSSVLAWSRRQANASSHDSEAKHAIESITTTSPSLQHVSPTVLIIPIPSHRPSSFPPNKQPWPRCRPVPLLA